MQAYTCSLKQPKERKKQTNKHCWLVYLFTLVLFLLLLHFIILFSSIILCRLQTYTCSTRTLFQ